MSEIIIEVNSKIVGEVIAIFVLSGCLPKVIIILKEVAVNNG